MEYEVNIDNFDRDQWERCAGEFADYNIYQTTENMHFDPSYVVEV